MACHEGEIAPRSGEPELYSSFQAVLDYGMIRAAKTKLKKVDYASHSSARWRGEFSLT